MSTPADADHVLNSYIVLPPLSVRSNAVVCTGGVNHTTFRERQRGHTASRRYRAYAEICSHHMYGLLYLEKSP